MALDLANFINNTKLYLVKHSPEILIGTGISGMITSTILAVKSTPKALDAMEQAKKKKNVEKLTFLEVVDATWKYYILPATISVGSALCIIGANSIQLNRNAAAIAAYTLSETTLQNYQEKVVEKLGPKKEQQVHDEMAKDRVEKLPVNDANVIYTGLGDTLCLDSISGRYFKCDIDRIRRVENELNRQMRDEMYITLNEFYAEIGLDSIKLGDELGWHIDKSYIDISFSAQLSDKDQPCLVLDYKVIPINNFI